MKCLNDILEEAKLTGNGLALRYKEKPSFRLSIEDYKCPYCKNERNNESYSDWYETAEDIKNMIENDGYSWTEDCKCGVCGSIFSMRNGC
ncbi:TPA: hypothetical protein ACKOHV_003028 [Clostridioides difficile]|uniref:hypothetical protein n=1 Tax=Clostridioides difficile TaxID=1496 RepID=UPI00374E90A9